MAELKMSVAPFLVHLGTNLSKESFELHKVANMQLLSGDNLDGRFNRTLATLGTKVSHKITRLGVNIGVDSFTGSDFNSE